MFFHDRKICWCNCIYWTYLQLFFGLYLLEVLIWMSSFHSAYRYMTRREFHAGVDANMLIIIKHQYSILPHQQFAYWPMHSCEDILGECTNDWHRALDRGHVVGVLCLDMSKAFDSVPHDKLIAELQSFGLAGTALHSEPSMVPFIPWTSHSDRLLPGVLCPSLACPQV